MRGQIWAEIFGESWAKTVRSLDLGARGRLVTAVLLYCIYVLLVWSQIDAATATLEVQLKLLATATPWLLVPIVFLFRVATTIPDREVEARKRIDALRHRLHPRFDVSVANGGEPLALAVGNTRTAFSGKSQSVVFGKAHYLALQVRNCSERPSSTCEAHLIALTGDNGRQLSDYIHLRWFPSGGHAEEWTTLPPGASRTLAVFAVTGEYPTFLVNTRTVELDRFFDGGTEFIGIVSMTDHYWAARKVTFKLTLGGVPQLAILNVEEDKPLRLRDVEADSDAA